MVSTKRFLVTGLVQGVFYRAATQQRARELGVTGWVRNLPEGDVELVAQGDERALAELEAWLWQGPERARVEHVKELPAPDAPLAEGEFVVRRENDE